MTRSSTNSLLDVYGQILSTNGTAVGTNFLVNQFTSYNQRTPAVAALPNGGFVVSWVSEQERLLAPDLGSNTVYSSASALAQPSVDIYARLFNASGTPSAGEFLVDTDASPCANPAMAVASDGSFLVAWTEKDLTNHTNSWDIHARPFSSAGVGGNSLIVNTYLIGDQTSPTSSPLAWIILSHGRASGRMVRARAFLASLSTQMAPRSAANSK